MFEGSVRITSPGSSGINANSAAAPPAINPANDPVSILAQAAAVGSPLERGQALRALDGMTGDRNATNALTRGQSAASAGRTNAAQTCTIEVRYKPVALGADHAFIVTTDSDSVWYFRGGPQSNNTGLNSPSNGSSGSNNDLQKPPHDPRFGIYGPIVTEYGRYTSKSVDWTTSLSGSQVVDRIAGSCNQIEGELARHMNAIEAAKTNYMPLEQNSNSTVREALERAGYPNVRPVVWAPAWSTQLP